MPGNAARFLLLLLWLGNSYNTSFGNTLTDGTRTLPLTEMEAATRQLSYLVPRNHASFDH